ncbi:poly(ADP-ribose) glycohydrolase, partial [Plakobranchus ocellatus]
VFKRGSKVRMSYSDALLKSSTRGRGGFRGRGARGSSRGIGHSSSFERLNSYGATGNQFHDPGTSSSQHSSGRAASSEEDNYECIPFSQLRRAPECLNQMLPDLKPTPSHKVLFRIPAKGWSDEPCPPFPFPNIYSDRWDLDHVYMPCSSYSLVPSPDGPPVSRWKQIEAVLSQEITGYFELEEAILSYNQHYIYRWSFDSLRDFFHMDKRRKDNFFTTTLPFIQKLALALPSLVTQSLPILKQGSNMSLTISQQQAACLLANAFFCTFPKRNAYSRSGILPDINFSNLYKGGSGDRKIEKLKCILNYFERIRKKMPTGTLTYSRQVLHEKATPNWNKSDAKLADLHVASNGNIEDDGKGMLQADFANKYVGGGVLGNGLVQEEIRFVICPEMILSRLFTQVLQDNEVLIMTGCERFNDYSGYSDSFAYTGNYNDKTPRDSWGRMHTQVVAMDALSFRISEAQYEESKIIRELNKAFCAFQGREYTTTLPAVCTGNWGCGAFKGDKHLKALIQLMAASMVDRQVCYFTFGDEELSSQLEKVHGMLRKLSITVKELYNIIKDYNQRVVAKQKYQWGKKVNQSLFEFIASALGESLEGLSSSQKAEYSSEDFGSWEDM